MDILFENKDKFSEISHRKNNWGNKLCGLDDPENWRKAYRWRLENSILKFQTLMSDILLDGAFNVNSTLLMHGLVNCHAIGKVPIIGTDKTLDFENDQVLTWDPRDASWYKLPSS